MPCWQKNTTWDTVEIKGFSAPVFSWGGFYLDDLWCTLYLLPRKLFSPNRFLTSLSQTVSCGSFSQKPAKIPSTLWGGSIDVVSSTMTFQKVIESKRYNNPTSKLPMIPEKSQRGPYQPTPSSKYNQGNPPFWDCIEYEFVGAIKYTGGTCWRLLRFQELDYPPWN